MQPSAIGRSLSDDNCARNQSMIIDVNHFIDFFLVSYIWFYPNSESQQFLVPGHPGSIRIGFLTQLGLKVRPVIGWSLQKL